MAGFQLGRPFGDPTDPISSRRVALTTLNPTISAVGATDFAQPRGPLRLTESRPASFRWKMLSASTTPSPQFTSRNPARQRASTSGPVSRLPVRKENRPSRSRILTMDDSRRTTFPARIARTGHGSLTFRGRRLHLKHRLRADDRAFVGERVKRLDRQVADPRGDDDVADGCRGEAVG
jgi:hypothetical protein